jgi:hypothetical protein
MMMDRLAVKDGMDGMKYQIIVRYHALWFSPVFESLADAEARRVRR